MNDVLHRRDGSIVEVEFSSAPLVVQGEVAGAVVTFSDIGRRRAVERLKDEFVSVVSHELRTPLTSVRDLSVCSPAAASVSCLAQGSRLVDVALSNTERLVRLVNDILDLERIDAGELELQRSTGPLEPVLEAPERRSPASPRQQGRGVRLRRSCRGRLSTVTCWSALVNLVGNA